MNYQSVARAVQQIRFGLMTAASLLGNDEAQTPPMAGKPHALRGSVTKRCGGASGGWRRNGGKVAAVNQGDLCGPRTAFMPQQEPKSRRAGVRASVGARKRRNGRGAKGRRKVDA